MQTLAWPESEKHPLHPGMTTSQFEATRRDLSHKHPDWSAKEVERYIVGIIKPQDDACLIQRHSSPVNILGGYRFPEAPVVDLSPIEPEPDDIRLSSTSQPPPPSCGDGWDIPDFLRRT